MGFWQQLIQPLRQNSRLLVKSQCPCCQRSTPHPLCPACERQFRSEPSPDTALLQGYPWPLFAAGLYQGQLKRIIAALKYQGQSHLGPYLGEWLGQVWQLQLGQSQRLPKPQSTQWIVVPIPLHASKQQQRGYNQAELIGRGFCRLTNLPLSAHGLVRQQSTTPQFGLSAQSRQQNLTNAFQLGEQLKKHRSSRLTDSALPTILLLDDIFTTGATVLSAQRTLENAGFKVGGVLTVAFTPKWETT